MDKVKHVLLEDPYWLMLVLAVVASVGLVTWFRRRTRSSLLRAVVPLAVAGAVWGTATLVETEREKLIATARELASTIAEQRGEDIPRYLTRNFAARIGPVTVTREQVARFARSKVSEYAIEGVELHRFAVDVKDRTAIMRVVSDLRLPGGEMALVWELRWVRTDAGWKVHEVGQPKRTLTPLP